jgi:ankyrin repeat protein
LKKCHTHILPLPHKVEAVDSRGRTALHCALSSSTGPVAEAAALLLQRGASAGRRDHEGATPLHCGGGTQAMVLLLGAGAEVDARDHEERTPLLRVLASRQHSALEIEEQVRLLINHGADVNVCDHARRAALSYAVGSCAAARTVQALLEAGASVGGEAGATRLIVEAVAAADDRETAADAGVIGALLDAGVGVSLGAAHAFVEHASRVAQTVAGGAGRLAPTTARLLGAAMRAHDEAEDARVAGKLAAALAAAVEADRRDVASGLHSLAAGAAAEARRLEAARAAAAAEREAVTAERQAVAAERAELLRLRAEVAAAPAAAGTDGGGQSGDGGSSSQDPAQPRAKRARGAAT